MSPITHLFFLKLKVMPKLNLKKPKQDQKDCQNLAKWAIKSWMKLMVNLGISVLKIFVEILETVFFHVSICKTKSKREHGRGCQPLFTSLPAVSSSG